MKGPRWLNIKTNGIKYDCIPEGCHYQGEKKNNCSPMFSPSGLENGCENNTNSVKFVATILLDYEVFISTSWIYNFYATDLFTEEEKGENSEIRPFQDNMNVPTVL